jgi:hypothetical protein
MPYPCSYGNYICIHLWNSLNLTFYGVRNPYIIKILMIRTTAPSCF